MRECGGRNPVGFLHFIERAACAFGVALGSLFADQLVVDFLGTIGRLTEDQCTRLRLQDGSLAWIQALALTPIKQKHLC